MKAKFGIFADLHVDIMHDGEQRLEKFLDACRKEDVDFVIHLGDFCYPDEGRKNVTWPEKQPINIENALKYPTYANKDKIHSMYMNFEKSSYHVLGNHDCDMCTKRQVLDYYGAKYDSYYSFDVGGVHFVALDGNFTKIGDEYVDYANGNYFNEEGTLPYFSDKEIEWLEKDLASTPYPSVLFSHQAIAGGWACIKNSDKVRKVIGAAPNKVLLAINGHEHTDRLSHIDDVWYLDLNSMSCLWLDLAFTYLGRYTEEIDEKYPNMRYVAPYKDPLFAIITVDDDGIDIKGVQSEWVGPSPDELGAKEDWSWCKDIPDLSPSIQDRYIPLK